MVEKRNSDEFECVCNSVIAYYEKLYKESGVSDVT